MQLKCFFGSKTLKILGFTWEDTGGHVHCQNPGFQGAAKRDTFPVSNFKRETGFGLLSPS